MPVLVASVWLVIDIFAGLKRPKTLVSVIEEDGKSCTIRSDEEWQEEGRVHCPSEVCFGLLLLTSG